MEGYLGIQRKKKKRSNLFEEEEMYCSLNGDGEG